MEINKNGQTSARSEPVCSLREKQLLLISLARITFLSLAEKLILLKKLDSSDDLALLSLTDLSEICGRPLEKAVWNGEENLRMAKREEAVVRAKNIQIVPYAASVYPALLRECVNAPFALFCMGDISCLSGKTVSVVGTRRIAPEARKAAVQFAYDAVSDGVTVVSGLAYGVDSAAHSGAVEACLDAADSSSYGKTCAVLPCGIDTIVPYANRKLAENILRSGGAIVSEYVPGIPAERWRFVQRNRIIATLSPATLVVQAPCGSGSLITADFALECGRDVLFHKAAFSENACSVRNLVESELQAKFAMGKAGRKKLENTPEKYLEAGAPVIENYQDFCKCMTEMPGMRRYINEKNMQLELI